MKAFVYFNLHRKLWSIKALEGDKKGLVIGHAPVVYLEDVKPKVSEVGRQRVLKEQRKNVHAGLVGTVGRMPSRLLVGGKAITYNPYKSGTFVYKDDGQEFRGADCALLDASTRSVKTY